MKDTIKNLDKIKIKSKVVTAEQFLRVLNKFNSPKPNIKDIKKLKRGTFLARIINPEKSTITDYFFTDIYIRSFNFPYSCNHNIKKGKELLISNMPLPPVKF